ncbi:hypothetical protein DN752_13265 [Echinicola strongylocentroti]|uniref:Uncharacterized protein n=1 Tax=Echinicola strongylocentroti TaxID=1795355 RepID=A0A2Z4IJ74_9BACT|nr:hypothetical protein DN752_13265 [Echinicola strongylocentroti]
MLRFGKTQKIEDISDRGLQEKQTYHLERIDKNVKFISDVLLAVVLIGGASLICMFLGLVW